MKPLVVELSTWGGVEGWGWSISLRVVRIGTPTSLQVLKRELNSAPALEGVTFCMTVDVTRRAPLFLSVVSALILPESKNPGWRLRTSALDIGAMHCCVV